MISSTIQLISNSPQHEQRFITDKMWEAIMNMNQLENRQPLVQVAVWTIGEYGESGGFDGKSRADDRIINSRALLVCDLSPMVVVKDV